MIKFDNLFGDYFKLFVRREGKVVWGRNWTNLWLLTGVLALTFLAISFSNASLNYLSFKMNDPFINWVDIQNDYGEGDIDGLITGLSNPDNMNKYHFVNHQIDYSNHYMFYDTNDHTQYFACRFFDSFKANPLIEAILDEDNVVDGMAVPASVLEDKLIGVIITEDAIKKLGYEKDIPAFISLSRYCVGADKLKFDLIKDFGHLPVPILAVVRRLPMNMDIVATRFFYQQQRNDMTYPFNLNHEEYATELNWYIPQSVDRGEFEAFVHQQTDRNCEVSEGYMPFNLTFKPGSIISALSFGEPFSVEEADRINRAVMEKYKGEDVCRLHNYLFSDYELPLGSYLAVRFRDLDQIREFESFAKSEYKVRIEMSQINAKENFNSVSVMANILSWSIIVFSIICIMLFVVNLFQSYFQKVKRNMGTFKAFGISNATLISVYVLIMIVTILISILISLAFTYLVELLLPLLGILKDGEFNYLALWSFKTFYSVLIIIICSVSTVWFVMKNLLRATPGDLIYDRQ